MSILDFIACIHILGLYQSLCLLMLSNINMVHGISIQENEFRQVKNLDGRWKFRLAPICNPNVGFEQKWYSSDPWYPVGFGITQTEVNDDPKTIWMPVPSSYNDITQDIKLREHVGWVWYQSQPFLIPKDWTASGGRILLRFGSVNYYAAVWVDGESAGEHVGGHVPFEFDVTSRLDQSLGHGDYHVITVAVNNTLHHGTIPPADLDQLSDEGYPRGYARQTPLFDFFNYAGIHRSVYLYRVSAVHVSDVVIRSTLHPGFGVEMTRDVETPQTANVSFDIRIGGNALNQSPPPVYGCKIAIKGVLIGPSTRQSNHSIGLSSNSVIVATLAKECVGGSCHGSVLIPDPELWWPIGMSSIAGFQYEAHIQLTSGIKRENGGEIFENSVIQNLDSVPRDDVTVIDAYVQKFGIRSIAIGPPDSRDGLRDTDQSNRTHVPGFHVNGRPFYFRGMGWHEDHVIRGRGFDWALTLKDFNLIGWLGANSFRTSHYPYAEEIMDLCDEMGIVVINECPGVGLRFFNNQTLALHQSMMAELISRDKNRPSTVLWSVANEPRSALTLSAPYFEAVVSRVRQLDPTRYVTAALYEPPGYDLIGKYLDVICINRYFGWYEEVGNLDIIKAHMTRDLRDTWLKYRKPIVVTEFGSETIPGIHSDPPSVFSEEYQVQLIKRFHSAFDLFRNPGPPNRTDLCRPADDQLIMLQSATPEACPAFPRALVGEMIWNFADFQTPQTISRAFGNRKGVFTREGRYPKSAAFVLRQRYTSLGRSTSRQVETP